MDKKHLKKCSTRTYKMFMFAKLSFYENVQITCEVDIK